MSDKESRKRSRKKKRPAVLTPRKIMSVNLKKELKKS